MIHVNRLQARKRVLLVGIFFLLAAIKPPRNRFRNVPTKDFDMFHLMGFSLQIEIDHRLGEA